MSLTARTRIKARLLPRWPAAIKAGTMLRATRSGSTLTLDFDLSELDAASAPGLAWRLPIYDPAAALYRYVEVDTLAGAGPISLAQISDMSADARGFNAAASNAAMRASLGFDEAVDDRVAALVQNGSGLSWSYNDGAGTLTASWNGLPVQSAGAAVGTRPALNLIAGAGISLTVADNAGSARTDVTVTASGTGGIAFAGLANNLEIATGAAANSLFVALKTHGGTDPTGGDPITIVFQTADGAAVTRTITGALSLAISPGSTLGTANNEAFRFWLVAFDDAGTMRLALINCRDRTTNSIYPLGGHGIASSSAEGGAGGADSAHLFYSATAVSSKPYTVLGYLEYPSGLATAGTYANAPTRVVLHQRGMKLPGDVVQTRIGLATTEVSHNSLSYTQTNLEVSITLNSTSNVVNYTATAPLYALTVSGAPNAVFAQMHRNGAVIGMSHSNYISTTGASSISVGTINGFDFPNTSSALTYEVYTRTGATTTTVEYPEAAGGGTVGVVVAKEIMA